MLLNKEQLWFLKIQSLPNKNKPKVIKNNLKTSLKCNNVFLCPKSQVLKLTHFPAVLDEAHANRRISWKINLDLLLFNSLERWLHYSAGPFLWEHCACWRPLTGFIGNFTSLKGKLNTERKMSVRSMSAIDNLCFFSSACKFLKVEYYSWASEKLWFTEAKNCL